MEVLRRGISPSLGFVCAFVFGVLAVLPSAHAENYDPICSKYVESRGFQKFYSTRKGERKAGDTIYWETKVLPDFERIAKDPKFQTEANLNAQFKLTLASYGIRENEIAEANENRLISDCSRQPQLEGCLAMQTYCVRDYIEKEWPKAVENFNSCFDKSSREHGCGTDFQTADGIAKNIAVLQKFQGKVGSINDEMLKLPNVPDYLNDITSSFKNFSARVQDLLAKGRAKIEDLKKQEAAAADKRYQSTVAMQNNLGQACRAFNECKGYLDRKGYTDNKQLLNQISSCQVNNESTPESGKQFDETMKTMKDIHSVAQKSALADLVQDTFDESLAQAGQQYLESYFALHGKLPTEGAFKLIFGAGFPSDVLKKTYAQAKASEGSLKKMDVGAEIGAFNAQVKALNAACSAARDSGAGAAGKENDADVQGKLAAVGNAHAALLYGSRFGAFLALKSFSKKVGTFDSDACFSKGEGMKELSSADSGRVMDAMDEVIGIIGDKGRELMRNRKDLTDPDDPGSGLRFFLENDPLVLRELIRKTNSAEQAMLLCGSIEKIYAKEARRKTWSKILTAVSVVAGVAAVILSGGAAAPLVFALSATSLGVGTVNGLVNIDYAASTKAHMHQSNATGTFDRDLSNSLIKQADAEIKGEAVGLALQFVPMVGKSAAGVVSKTVIKPIMASKVMTVLAESKAWGAVSKAATVTSAPVTKLMTSLKSGAATYGDMATALVSKMGPKTSKVMIAAFNNITRDMAPDAAMIFAASALTHPDPYSKEGLLQMLEAFVKSRGLSALGASGREMYTKYKAGGMKAVFGKVPIVTAEKDLVFGDKGRNEAEIVSNSATETGFVKLPSSPGVFQPANKHVEGTLFASPAIVNEGKNFKLANGKVLDTHRKLQIEMTDVQSGPARVVVKQLKDGKWVEIGEAPKSGNKLDIPFADHTDRGDLAFDFVYPDGKVVTRTTQEMIDNLPNGLRFDIQASNRQFRNSGFIGGHTEQAWNKTLGTYGDRIKVEEGGTASAMVKVPGSDQGFLFQSVQYSVDGVAIKSPKTLIRGTNDQVLAFQNQVDPLVRAALKKAKPSDYSITVPLEGGDLVIIRYPMVKGQAKAGEMYSWYVDLKGKNPIRLLPEKAASLDVPKIEKNPVREMILDPKVTTQQIVETVPLYQKSEIGNQKLTDVQFSKGKMGDEDGFVFLGYDRVNIKGKVDGKDQDVGYLSYQIDAEDPGLMEIGWSRVDEAYRGQNVQNLLFKRVFEQNPNVTRIRTGLDQTNASEFNSSLIGRLKSESGFVANSKPIDPTLKARLEKKGEGGLLELNTCCSEYLNHLQTKNPEEFNRVMTEALKGTPAWKTREKFGFGKLCTPPSWGSSFSKGGYSFVVHFEVCK